MMILILTAAVAGAQTISVASVNCWSGLTYKGLFASGRFEGSGDMSLRYDNLVEQLGSYRPDIIGLVEANPLPSYARKLAEGLKYQYIWNVSRGGVRVGKIGLPANLREGEAILARENLGLMKAGSKQVSGGPSGNTFSFQAGAACQIFGGTIKVGKREVYIFVTQWNDITPARQESLEEILKDYTRQELGAGEFLKKVKKAVMDREKRVKQAEATLDYINEIAGTSDVILMGSMNTVPGSAELDVLKAAGFTDAFAVKGSGRGITYDGTRNSNIIEYFPEIAGLKPQLRLDYIFIRGRHLAISDCSVFLDRDRYGSYPSDHYGVYARISVR
ncbi:MAG: endonuclease/exonuclease/phosphatase family protein [Spirochaetales bacterium]|nr:endonuclease/exonuclease/phosphatase family protein [Spirochaetales bacterium]